MLSKKVSSLMNDHSTRIERTYESLKAVAVGDAFGEMFYSNLTMQNAALEGRRLRPEELPPEPWAWSDDTNMAAFVFDMLSHYQNVDQNALSENIALRYHRFRNYSSAIAKLLPRIRAGEDWKAVSIARYDGRGSDGIDMAKRVVPIGAYFSDDLEKAVNAAQRSAEVTHKHADGIAGTIVLGTAISVSWQYQGKPIPERPEFIDRRRF